MPSTKWLRERYRHLHPEVRQVLMENKHPSSIRHWSYESRLKKVIKKYPNSHPLLSSLISLLREKKRYLEAIQSWHQVKAKFRNKPSPYFQRATWAMEAAKYSQAAHFLGLCLRRDTGYFGETAHFWRAFALFRTNHFAEAIKHLHLVSENYEEPYFFGLETWSKARLLAELQEKS